MLKRKRLLIAGAGGWGREVLDIAKSIPEGMRDWDVAGFLDDSPNAEAELKVRNVLATVLGTIKDYRQQESDVLICGMGNTRTKLSVCMDLVQRGANFTNVIHPGSQVSANVRIGVGNVVAGLTVISDFATLGNFITVNVFCGIGHDSTIGDGCTFSPFSSVTGSAVLERGVFMGTNSAVLPSVRVDEFATIAAGSVAYTHVKAGCTVIGVPAKTLLRGKE